ncbi:MAG TPA: DUF1553 domain-containing protein [Pirellulales bacterium]|nr:DUF1553 domain-containing protein [Pirellulales bacterium]
MPARRLLCLAVLTMLISPAMAEETSTRPDFDSGVAPLLARHCLGCHNPSDKKGGLDLTSEAGLKQGGESGPAVAPGNVDDSLLWQRVAGDEMPPPRKAPDKSTAISGDEKEVLRRWIVSGARWGTADIDPLAFTTDRRAGRDWWSLRPIAKSVPPPVNDENWGVNEIDAFVLARLEASGLPPSPPADRRSLIRRVHFDLVGLPPTPEEVEAFLNDASPRAYEELVERLLASPQYGERWARHWLDVVRYGESQGFERDRLRPNAWPYRDWVVQALNDDMPYDEFVRWQLAGDSLRPDHPPALIATGFLVAGPWDEVGQTQQSEAMKAVVRQDELEDIVGVTAQTFLGLTANCARCHDHKFDPVSQVDYYRLSAALGGVRHGERDFSATGQADAARLAELRRQVDEARARLAVIDAPVRARIVASRRSPNPTTPPPVPIARWEFDRDTTDQIGSLDGELHGGARLENGRLVLSGADAYLATAPLDRELGEKTLEAWVQLNNADQRGGGVMSVQTLDGGKFDAIVYGEREPRRWMAGSNGFVRSREVGGAEENEATGALVHVAIVYGADNRITLYRNGRPYGDTYLAAGLERFSPGQSQVVFGMRHAPVGGNKMFSGAIWRANLYDRACTAAEVAAAAVVTDETVTDDELLAQLTAAERSERQRELLTLSRLETQLRLLSGGKAYAVSPREPAPTCVLRRGDTRQPAEEVAAGGVAAVGEAEFGLPANAPEAQRRARLADWIASRRNPLTARVVANRLWHYHFGAGIVETPNDFGFNGGRPSHPELLDWLADSLMEHGWSLKQLHRTIVQSATYRQASAIRPEAARIDAGNRLLWRKTPLRLEAEMLRDAVLVVSGQLNPTMGGPGFHDFRTFTNNSQFYEVIDMEGFTFQRRSLYRMGIRSGTNPLLDVLDCPDPSTTAPARAVTTTPLQALALLNDSFMLRMADRFAERVRAEAGQEPAAQVDRAYRLALARRPNGDETAAASDFVARHGLPALARVLFNANEFLYVE